MLSSLIVEVELCPEALQVALGLMIATGRLDEAAGRLVAVGQEQRRAG